MGTSGTAGCSGTAGMGTWKGVGQRSTRSISDRQEQHEEVKDTQETCPFTPVFIPTNNQDLRSLLPLSCLCRSCAHTRDKASASRKGSLFGLPASNAHRRGSEPAKGVCDRAEAAPRGLRCAGCPGGDAVHQRSGSGLFVFGVPGMHFPAHSLFWSLVTFQQQQHA